MWSAGSLDGELCVYLYIFVHFGTGADSLLECFTSDSYFLVMSLFRNILSRCLIAKRNPEAQSGQSFG